VPYLTPETVPDTQTCRALLIPDSAEWLAIFSGALTELTQRWNWQQQGVSVDDALAVAVDVLNGYFSGCVESGCEQPGGYALLRVGANGHVEQLIDGEWVEPQGVNAYPAIPARFEPTADERRCLAAANAARCLQELYEQVSEVAQYDLGVAELIIALVAALALRFFWIAPIINGILLIAAGILETILAGAKYITADVWDTTFDDVIRCFLYECATDDAGVVSFDYDCLMGKLYELNVTPPFNEARARLAAQLALLLPVVGGVDSLNQFGAVDAVEEADCADCETGWCYVLYAADSDGGFVPENCGGVMGDWVSGDGWYAADVTLCGGANRTVLNMSLIFSESLQIDTIDMHYDYEKITSVGTTEGIGVWAENFATPLYSVNQAVAVDGIDESVNITSGIPQPMTRLDIFMQPAYAAQGGTGLVTIIQMTGSGDKPTWLEDLGWVECPTP